MFEKKDYYFGSVSAVFTTLTEKEVGITKNTLLHAGLYDGKTLITQRAIIKQSHLIRCKQ